MSSGIRIDRTGIVPNTTCTLKCKYCSGFFPHWDKADEPMSVIKKELEVFFQIVEYTNEMRISSAEALLAPHIVDVIKETAKYKDKFGYLMFITNGTYIPKSDVIECIKELPCKVLLRIDDYGELSCKKNELAAICEEAGINYDLRCYTGSDQIYGGWVDLGWVPVKDKGYTSEECARVFNNCILSQEGNGACSLLWKGHVWWCCTIASAAYLGMVPDSPGDRLNLLENEPIDVMREKFLKMSKGPFDGCRYCYGLDPNTTRRIPAAEQLQ